MLYKYNVLTGDVIFGLMYDDGKEVASLGGFARDREVMEEVLREVLGVATGRRPRWVQRNKVRWSWRWSWTEYVGWRSGA